jgi:tRNA A-37 threonylcarbamoyl transferase component Bud32
MTLQDWQHLEFARVRWWVDPQWRDQLLNLRGLRLPEWERDGRVEIIKQSLHRTVYRVGLGERAVFVKHYPIQDLPSRIKRWLRPAKALREWRKALVLRRHAIPTIRPLAVGVHADGASSFVSEALDGAVGLHEFVERHWADWRRLGNWSECRALVKELGGFLGHLFRSGIVHADLHGDNILVRQNKSGQREWFLIDPYDIEASSWLGRMLRWLQPASDLNLRSLQTSLALVAMAYWYALRPTDRLRCWRELRRVCGNELPMNRDEERAFLDAVDQEVWQRTLAVWSKRSNRCVKANRDFYQLRSKRCQAWASQILPADWLLQVLRDPFRPLKDATTTILKTSRHGQVAVVHGPDGTPLVYKLFSPRNRLDRLASLCRESPAQRCYRSAYRLELARIPTARPLAVIQQRKRGTIAASFLVTEFVPDAPGLIEFVKQCQALADQGALRQLMRQLAKHVRRLHDFRLSHRDMKAANFLVRVKDGTPQPLFIDLRGIHTHRWLTRSRRQKDLARLALSARTTLATTRTDLLRFLVKYLGTDRSQWRTWWHRVSRLASKKVARNVNRQRTIS